MERRRYLPATEASARENIDRHLMAGGWLIQDKKALNLSAARGVAVREMQSHGGPADSDVTKAIQDRANQILANSLRDVKRVPYEQAMRAVTTHEKDLRTAYIEDLSTVIDFDGVGTKRFVTSRWPRV